MTNYRTEENISIIAMSMRSIILIAVFISFIFTCLYFLIFIFSRIMITTRILCSGITIFFTYFISLLLVRTEFFLTVKNDYKIRPPLQIVLISIVTYVLLFIIVPDTFMGGQKISLPIFTILVVPSVIIGLVSQKILYLFFLLTIAILSKIYTGDILGESAFKENIEFKFYEFLRHNTQFTVLLISFTIPRFAVSKIRRSLIFTLFFEILHKNIRKTDLLGILENGKTAGILSNGNDIGKAQIQAKRLVEILENNQLLVKKLKVYNSEIKCGLVQVKKEYETHVKFFARAFETLDIALKSDAEQIIVA